MQRIIALFIILFFITSVFPPRVMCIQDDSDTNWSDLSHEEKEAVREKILRKYNSGDIAFKDWSDYTELERQQLGERWTEIKIELIAESLRLNE